MEQFRIQERAFSRIRTLLERGVYHAVDTLSLSANITKDPVPYEQRETKNMQTLLPGRHWGNLFDCAWVHATGQFPDTFPREAATKERKHWVVLMDLSAEGLVYNRAGEPVQGLTSATSRNEFPLGLWGKRTIERDAIADEDGTIDFWADFTCCDVEGQYRNSGRVKEACTAWVDDLCRDTFYDWVICQSLFVGLMENGEPYGEEVGRILEKAADAFTASHVFRMDPADGRDMGSEAFKNRDAYFVDETPTALDLAGERLSIIPDAETEPTKKTQIVLDTDTLIKVREILSEILNAPNTNPSMVYSAVGHSHLDLLFLWPERETYRKCARTIANVLRIMDADPTYKFTLSQAPVYKWLKEQYPSLYARMLERIREGRIEIVGALYIECDTNLPDGESLVRQFLYGKRFFREEFGKEMEICFLPDVFGYSAALPQLMKLSNVPYFTTNKLSMNDTNRFPRYTFWWYGIDGTRVLTHMPPENSYTSACVPQMALYGKHHYTDIDVCPRGLELYGLGDGGGGPGLEHVERRKRTRNLRGCPPFEDEFVIDFFKRIEKGADKYRSWHGELYFERHQGTYTSIAKQKAWNRDLERMLHTLEYAASVADGIAGFRYPQEWLTKAWEDVLLYQFHDCLPGSSIPIVYEQTQARYRELYRQAQKKLDEALNALSTRLGRSGQEGFLLLNPSSFARKHWLFEPESETVSQVALKPYEIRWQPKETGKHAGVVRENGLTLENERIRVVFAKDGTITELYDKEIERSFLQPGKRGNVLTLYPDELTHWDINKNYLKEPGKQARLTGWSAWKTETDAALEFRFVIGERSSMLLEVTLAEHEKRVDFKATVDWREEYQMLRVAFPVDVVTDHAVCGIQFGSIERPTHHNTSWDEAKFEVCAQKWVDMADAAGGLALLSDCKYGYKIWDQTLDLCLLRSQNCPAEQGDLGRHTFVYSIYPHAKDAWDGGVIRGAELLNLPVYEMPAAAGGGKESFCPFSIEQGSVMLDTVKKAEDGNGLILRLHEAQGGRTKMKLRLAGYRAESFCNLLEEPLEREWKEQAGVVETDLHPFEIISIRVIKED